MRVDTEGREEASHTHMVCLWWGGGVLGRDNSKYKVSEAEWFLVHLRNNKKSVTEVE